MTVNEQLIAGSTNRFQDNTITAAMLSDDAGLCALLQQMLGLCPNPRFSLSIVSSHQYNAHSIPSVDILLTDTQFNGGDFLAVARAIDSQPLETRLVLLLNDDELISLAPGLANFARSGVDLFIPKSDLSLRQVLNAINTGPATTPLYRSPPVVAGESRQATTDTGGNLPTATHLSTEPALPVESGIVHALAVDLENSRVHIDAIPGSPLYDESDKLLDLEEWYRLLQPESAETFRTLLLNAQNYRPVARQIQLQLLNPDDTLLSATLADIQLKNNGQGRVVGASAHLLVASPIDSTALTGDQHHGGFDNLPDSDLISQSSVWQNVTRSLPMLCLLLDEQGVIVRVLNEGDLGNQLPSELAPGVKLANALDIESLDGLGETISRTLNTGKPHHQTIAFPHTHGLRWLETHLTKLRGDSGLSRQVVWTAFDITSNRHDYQELLKNYDSLLKILDDAPVLFFQKDSAGRYLRVNKAFCDTFKLHADVISGRIDQEVFRDVDTQFTEVSSQALSLAATQDNFEYSYSEDLSGSSHHFNWHTLVQKRQGDNQVEFLCGFGIIDQVANDASGNGAPDNVSSIESRHKLAMSGALKQDFKTILNSLVSYAELALSQKNQGRANSIADHLSQVESTARHTRELVLEKSNKNGEQTNSALQLKPIIEETAVVLRPTLPASVSFDTIYKSDREKALVDEAAFKKIVMLLLLNAKSTAESAIATESDDQKIRLIHDVTDSIDQECAACGQSLNGNYISLTVQTAAANMTESTLAKLINAAKQSMQSSSDDNVIALTHRIDGHVLIRHANDTLSLQLLFNKA